MEDEKYTKIKITWIEFHEKTIDLPEFVEKGTHKEDEIKDVVEDWAEVGSKNSCYHYEVQEKELCYPLVDKD